MTNNTDTNLIITRQKKKICIQTLASLEKIIIPTCVPSLETSNALTICFTKLSSRLKFPGPVCSILPEPSIKIPRSTLAVQTKKWWKMLNYYINLLYLTVFNIREAIVDSDSFGRFRFVRTDRPNQSRRNENFTFHQNYPARSVKSQIVCAKEMVFQQKLLKKADFIC